MYKKLTLLLLLLGCKMAYGQYTDTTHYHIQMASSGSINRTDDGTAYLLNNSLNFGVKEKSMVLNATNSWVYGKQNNVLTNNDLSSALVFNLYKTFPHFYYWGLLNYNTSYSLKINNQFLGGAGVAYSVIDKKTIYINFSDGLLYDQSDLLGTGNYHTYRNSFRLQYHFAVRDLLTLDGSNFLQSSLSNGSDYIIRTTTTLGLKLRKWISLTTALSYNKMSITHSDNLIFTYGLAVDKYF
jgi:hypothetical protein